MNLAADQLIYVPLDIPPIDYDRERLLQYFDRRKALPQFDFLKAIGNPWHAVQLRARWIERRFGEIPGSSWRPDVRYELPKIVRVVEGLPFDQIERAYILEQIKDVPVHRDVSREANAELGPSTFRCLLLNDHPRTFYLRRGTVHDGTLAEDDIFPTLPAATNWFGMSNYTASHGSHMPPSGARKLMFCIWGRVHPDRWFDLLERSVAKFPQHCIWK